MHTTKNSSLSPKVAFQIKANAPSKDNKLLHSCTRMSNIIVWFVIILHAMQASNITEVDIVACVYCPQNNYRLR